MPYCTANALHFEYELDWPLHGPRRHVTRFIIPLEWNYKGHNGTDVRLHKQCVAEPWKLMGIIRWLGAGPMFGPNLLPVVVGGGQFQTTFWSEKGYGVLRKKKLKNCVLSLLWIEMRYVFMPSMEMELVCQQSTNMSLTHYSLSLSHSLSAIGIRKEIYELKRIAPRHIPRNIQT